MTIALAFRALMGETELLPALAAAGDDLPDELRARVDKYAVAERR